MSSFLLKNLTYFFATLLCDAMAKTTKPPAGTRQIAPWVRKQIEQGGERLWCFDDLPCCPCLCAGADPLTAGSRREAGTIEQGRLLLPPADRARKEPTEFLLPSIGSRPTATNPYSQQVSRQQTSSGSRHKALPMPKWQQAGFRLPRKLLGSDTVVHTRRPEAWKGLAATDAALLDFLRRAGRTSELSPKETVKHTLALCREEGRFKRLLKIAASEPPRVRAMLGAIGMQIGEKPAALESLRESLNPISRFDYGMLKWSSSRDGLAGEAASGLMRLFEHTDFDQVVLAASEHFHEHGLRPAIIEKDYYVTEALRIIASTVGQKTIFKGGTSLSKGWNLIGRFSEDIDIFLDPLAFDPALGRRAIDRELRALRDSLAAHPALTFLRQESRTLGGFGRSDRFAYPQRFGRPGEVAGQVLVEVGTASGRQPTATVELRSYVATFLTERDLSLDAEDEGGFPMRLLHFRRTFVEKLFAIHGKVELLKRDRRKLGSYARHYYDLFCLIGQPDVVAVLTSDEYAAIKADYDTISRAHFAQSYFAPGGDELCAQ